MLWSRDPDCFLRIYPGLLQAFYDTLCTLRITRSGEPLPHGTYYIPGYGWQRR